MIQDSSHNEISRSTNKLSRDIMKISDHQLGTKFRSKQDIYIYLTETLHFYLPPKEFVTKDFIKQIFRNEKELINMDQLKTIKVLRYAELSVKTLFKEIIDDENLKKYFPDIDINKKPIDREYFFNILNTVYPEYTKSLISLAQNSRVVTEMNEEKKDYILISDDWYTKLMSNPFISRKPGKTVQLLKESCKILKGRKPTVKKEIDFTLKRFKGMMNTQALSQKESIQFQQQHQNNIFEEDDDIVISGLQNQKIFKI